MNSELLERDDTVLAVIDVQEKLIKSIGNAMETPLRNLLQASKILRIPIIVTQQYTKGLGESLSWITPYIDEVIEKTSFSAASTPAFQERMALSGRSTVLLTGVEAHICVLQTALELKKQKFRVVVAIDAVASRRERDVDIALMRLRSASIDVITSEMALFEWLRDAKDSDFRAISALVR